ncbi:MAG: hypothetical protein GTN68_38740, partial [Candidatus Aminicenantes bacterium]|nr:hypothetical protein [Candidatus Aminicenantes bacterium]
GVFVVEIKWEDTNNIQESYEEWALVDDVYKDCQVPVDSKDEEENLLLKYARLQDDPKPGFLFAVSKAAGKDAKALFPNKPNSQTAPWSKKSCASKQNKWEAKVESLAKCPIDHTIFDSTHYVGGMPGWYMKKEGEKHYELCCNECKGYIRDLKKQQHWICCTENKGKCYPNCLNAFCDKCFKKKIQGMKSPPRACRSTRHARNN